MLNKAHISKIKPMSDEWLVARRGKLTSSENHNLVSDKFMTTGCRSYLFRKVGELLTNVTATGELDVHGVKQTRTIPGTLVVKGGVVTLTTEFMVKCVDHKITIPTLVFHNIAESIKVQVAATYTQIKK